jgi:integrase
MAGSGWSVGSHFLFPSRFSGTAQEPGRAYAAAMQAKPKLLQGVRLVALRLYGGGLRLLEGLTLRVKDVDLERGSCECGGPREGETV